MKTQNDIRRKNISEERRLNRLRNENNNIDISNFFENEIIRNERKLKKLQTNIDIRKMVIVKFVILMSINLV